MRDLRCPELITYPLAALLFTGVLLFVCRRADNGGRELNNLGTLHCNINHRVFSVDFCRGVSYDGLTSQLVVGAKSIVVGRHVDKLEAASRTEAVLWAIKEGFITQDDAP